MQPPPNAPLSYQEEVLQLMADGLKSHDIAETMCLSPHTVKNHKTNMCQKLNLASTTDLLCYAIKNATILQNGGG